MTAYDPFSDPLFFDCITKHFMTTQDGFKIVPIGHLAFYVMTKTCPKCGKRRIVKQKGKLRRCRKCKWKPA